MQHKTSGGFLISQIKQVQGRIFQRLLEESGIDAFNGAQGRILYVLWQTGQAPILEISKKTGLAKTTLTSMLDRMEASGLILRRPDGHDRRITQIVLTEQAKQYRGEYDAVSDRMAELFYQGFRGEEISSLEALLERVLENLNRYEAQK